MYFERMKEIRKAHKETQEEVGRILDLSQGSYWRLEKGDQPLTAEMIIRFCKHFHVSADYLLEININTNEPGEDE